MKVHNFAIILASYFYLLYTVSNASNIASFNFLSFSLFK